MGIETTILISERVTRISKLQQLWITSDAWKDKIIREVKNGNANETRDKRKLD